MKDKRNLSLTMNRPQVWLSCFKLNPDYLPVARKSTHVAIYSLVKACSMQLLGFLLFADEEGPSSSTGIRFISLDAADLEEGTASSKARVAAEQPEQPAKQGTAPGEKDEVHE